MDIIEEIKFYKNLIFDDFPSVLGNSIIIPRNFLFFRGHHINNKVITEIPKFFGSIEVGKSYSNGIDKKLDCFVNTEEIKLIDIRYLKIILFHILGYRKNNKFEKIIKRTMMAFGVCSVRKIKDFSNSREIKCKSFYFCSLEKQIELVKYFFENADEQILSMEKFKEDLKTNKILTVNPIEPFGFRIADTKNDSEVFLFIKELIGKYCDGVIAPKLFSPFHTEKTDNIMTSEILLFNPKKSGLRLLLPNEKVSISDFDIMHLLKNKVELNSFSEKSFFIKFGGKVSKTEDRNKYFDKLKNNKKINGIDKTFEVMNFLPPETEKEERSRLGIVPKLKLNSWI